MLKVLILSYVLFNSTLGKRLVGDVHRRVGLANTKTTFKFLYQCAEKNSDDYCLAFNLPLFTSVSQMALFSKGRTYQEALSFSYLRNRQEAREIYPAIKEILFDEKLIGSPKLTQNVYTDENNRFCPAFSYAYNKTFAGKTRTVVYSDPEITADEINDEVRSEGTGGFENIISSEMIKKGVGLNFISTYEITIIYDKKIKFNKKTTIPFKSGGKVTKISGISGKGVIKYAEIKSLDAKIVEIVAEGGKFSYLIIYPIKADGVIGLLEKLQGYSNFESIISQGKETCAKVTLNSKDFVAKIDLKKSAQEANYIQDFFKKGGLNLDGVSQNCDTYISSILSEIRLKPGPMNNDTSKENYCSEYPVNFTTEHSHLFFVTFTKKAGQFRTPILGVVVDTASGDFN